MTEEPAVVTSTRSPVKNPYHHLALFQIALGVALGYLVLRYGWSLAGRAQDLVAAFTWTELPEYAGTTNRLERALYHLQLGLVPFIAGTAIVFTLMCAGQAVLNMIGGFRWMTYAPPDSGLPYGLEHASRRAENLLEGRFINPGGLPGRTQRYLSMLSSRILLIPRYLQFLAEDLGKSTLFWIVAIAVLVVPCLLPPDPIRQSGLGVRWSWPVDLGLLAAAGVAARLLATFFSAPLTPRVRVHEQITNVDEAGNPDKYFNHLHRALDTIRWEGAPNREIRVSKPQLDKIQQGETGRFSGEFLVESQPVHHPRWLPFNALILDFAGGVILLAGYYTLMTRMLPDAPFPEETLRIQTGLMALAAFGALAVGVKLLRMARRLHDTMRYRSDLVWMKVDGNYTSSKIGLGDGRGSQMYTERPVFQSEVRVRVLAARTVTESGYPQGERVILNTRHERAFDERMDRLAEAIAAHDVKGGRLASIDFGAPAVQDLVQANLQIDRLSEAARQLPGPGQTPPSISGRATGPAEVQGQAREALPAEGPKLIPQEASEPEKTCPECAERIKAAARKCRFCGYRFDTEQGEEGSNEAS